MVLLVAPACTVSPGLSDEDAAVGGDLCAGAKPHDVDPARHRCPTRTVARPSDGVPAGILLGVSEHGDAAAEHVEYFEHDPGPLREPVWDGGRLSEGVGVSRFERERDGFERDALAGPSA